MLVYNESGEVITNPDLQTGRIEEKCITVWHIWDGSEWTETVDADGETVPYGEVMLPPEIAKDYPDGRVPDHWAYGVYVPYTSKELAEREAAQRRAEAEQRAYEWLPSAQAQVSAVESGMDDAYGAIAELGVDVADHAVTLDDIMEAIAELGTIVEAQNG